MRAALFLSGSPWTDVPAFKHMGHRFHIKSTEHPHSRYVVREKVTVQLRYLMSDYTGYPEKTRKILNINLNNGFCE